MKYHVEKTYNKIIEEVNLHFKTQNVLQKLNRTSFSFWDIYSVDVYEEYKFQCNLKDIKPTREEYISLCLKIENSLINSKYIINWATFEKLHISK